MLCKYSSFYSLFFSVIAAGTKLFLKRLVLNLGTKNLFQKGVAETLCAKGANGDLK